MSKKTDFFWASYADLMTSIFFVMLVLFVLSVAMMKKQQKATEEQLKRITEIENSVKALPKEYFTYQEHHKRFTLNRQIQFPPMGSLINKKDYKYLKDVGTSIQNLIFNLKLKYGSQNIKYMIVIEGMASKDGYSYNDELSYQRALSLFKFWKSSNIKFDSNICELIIAGSGIRGVGRYTLKKEWKNQRFLIQIIPKIGNLENL